jgi:hypothetical protein
MDTLCSKWEQQEWKKKKRRRGLPVLGAPYKQLTISRKFLLHAVSATCPAYFNITLVSITMMDER